MGKQDPDKLRSNAEERVQAGRLRREAMSPEDIQLLVHELQVHQVELEMQNEELRKSHAELETSRSRYADLYDFAPVGYLTLDTSGLIVEANLTAAKMLGRERNHLIGCPFPFFLQVGWKKSFREYLCRVMSTRERMSGEFRLTTKAGKNFFARIDGIFMEGADGGGSVRMVVADISDVKQAEEALRRSEEKYRELVECSNSIILRTDAEGNVTFCNRFAQEFFGYSMDRIVGRNVLDTIIPRRDSSGRDQAAIFMEILRDSWNRDFGNREIESRRKNGESAWISWAIKGFRLRGGKPEGLLCVGNDVTERKRAQRSLEIFAKKLERSNRELQEFAFVASHDLQEPMRKIQAFSERIQTKGAGAFNEETLDYFRRLTNSAERMQAMIRALLDYSRVRTRAEPFVRVELTEIVREVLSDLDELVQQVGGRVDLEALPAVEADPSQMHRLFLNLIGNALKFHKGGTPPVVRIRGETAEREDNPAGNRADGGICRIFIEDNGIGFDEKYLDRIFSLFQRLQGRSEFEGTGLGLSICRRIIDRHGGSITARSRPGEGATFIVTLPVKQVAWEVEAGPANLQESL